jgi:hypothetical protein
MINGSVGNGCILVLIAANSLEKFNMKSKRVVQKITVE